MKDDIFENYKNWKIATENTNTNSSKKLKSHIRRSEIKKPETWLWLRLTNIKNDIFKYCQDSRYTRDPVIYYTMNAV